jgi:hypothetical protein
MRLVDLDELSSETLRHLAWLASEREDRERQEREQRIARAAELLHLPSIGWHQRNRLEGAAR